MSAHARHWRPHPLLLGLAAATLLLASVGVGTLLLVRVGTRPPVAQAVPVTARPVAEPAAPEPAPPSALWEVERMERLVLERVLLRRQRDAD